jgi:hypothetical protein
MAEYNDEIFYAKALILPSVTTAVRDTMVADVGTIIYNSTTNKLNYCKTKAAGAGSWEAITSA